MGWVHSIWQNFFTILEPHNIIKWLRKQFRNHQLPCLVSEWVNQCPNLSVVYHANFSVIEIVFCGKKLKTRGVHCVSVIISIKVLHLLSLIICEIKLSLILIPKPVSQPQLLCVGAVFFPPFAVSVGCEFATPVKHIIFPGDVHKSVDWNLNEASNNGVVSKVLLNLCGVPDIHWGQLSLRALETGLLLSESLQFWVSWLDCAVDVSALNLHIVPNIWEVFSILFKIVSTQQIPLSHSLGSEHFWWNWESWGLLQRGSSTVSNQLKQVD